MFKVQEYTIGVDLINGYQYMDKIGTILQLFAQDINDDIEFTVLKDNAYKYSDKRGTLSIENIKDNIEEFRINEKKIELYATKIITPDIIIEHIKYFIGKIHKISSIINITELNKVKIMFRMEIEEETILDKIRTNFHKDNIQYFSSAFNEMSFSNNVKAKYKLFTGTNPIIPTIVTNGIAGSGLKITKPKNINVNNDDITYVFDAEIYISSVGNIKVETVQTEFDKIIESTINNKNLSSEIEAFIFNETK